ncbi:MAG: DEAD/DEAH box helicase [Cellvibrionaceae bacterium]
MFECPTRAAASTLVRPELELPVLPKWYERAAHQAVGHWRNLVAAILGPRQLRRILSQIHALDAELEVASASVLAERLVSLKQRVILKGYCRASLIESFAVIREMSGRVLGMKHFDSQLTGGWHLFQGRVAEMATGEGKTLTATLPVAAAAMAGIPVHVITVNDYLSKRDCDEMRPLYEALGFSVGCIEPGMSPDQRREVYRCDIVYCTNNELVFDYLKDYLVLKESPDVMHRFAERLKGNSRLDGELMMRGLHYAIIDEADSICMDEARTPLIISANNPASDTEALMYRQALEIAVELKEDTHYTRYEKMKQVEFNDDGEQLIDKLAQPLGAVWVGRVRRYELVRQALIAQLYFLRDRHYLVRDDKIQIIDEHTGRVMADRSWEKGLHQLLEVKEGCETTASRETLAKVSYQRFFRRYRFFAGMTGTAKEVKQEFWDIYQKQTLSVSTHHPLRCHHKRNILLETKKQQLLEIVAAAREATNGGRSVLIGTSTVGASEEVAGTLTQAGLEAQLLNAKQDHLEAEIIAEAGQPGRITIATSMAGRGTDIKLHPDVECHGGLHVILSQLQDAGRIDRQLAGRCARFGDPGSVELIVSLEDEWLTDSWVRPWLAPCLRFHWGQKLGLGLMLLAQKRLERRHSKMRYQLLKTDEQKGETLAFTQGNL